MTKIKVAKIMLILILLYPFSGYALEVEEEEIRQRPPGPRVDHIYLEQQSIASFCEVNNIDEYKKLIPSIFSMPDRPICRVEVANFYKMESAPPYLEGTVTILVKFKKPKSGEEMLGWHFLALTVTSEEALWGRYAGFPKVLRKVTLEGEDPSSQWFRFTNKYLGISYARDGSTPALKLALETKKGRPTRDEKRFLDFVSPIPFLTIVGGKVINRGVAGNGKYKIYEFEEAVPQIWKIRFGDSSLEYPNDPKNYLARLGIGKVVTGYWLNQKYRYRIPSKEE